MKIDYEKVLDELEEDLIKVERYSKTVDIIKLENKICKLKEKYTTYDDTNGELPF